MKKMQQEAEESSTITDYANSDTSTDSSANSPANSSASFQGSGTVDNNGSAGNKTKVGTKKTEAIDRSVTPGGITPIDKEYVKAVKKVTKKLEKFLKIASKLDKSSGKLGTKYYKEMLKVLSSNVDNVLKMNSGRGAGLWRAWVKLQEKKYGRTWYTLGLGKAWKNDGEAYWVEVHGGTDDICELGYTKPESAEMAAGWMYDTYNNDVGNRLPDAFKMDYTIEVPYGPKK